MTTIRVGNDIHVSWSVFSRNGQAYVLDGAAIRLWLVSGPFKKRITELTVIQNTVSFLIDAKEIHRLGIYKMVLSLTDAASETEDSAFDFTEVFQIVSKTYCGTTDAILDGNVIVTPSSIIDNIVVNNITNAADGEDLTVIDNLLKFRDRPAVNGIKGYKILRTTSSFAEQVTDEDTIYEIRYVFDLGGEEVEMPDGCMLKFSGGSLMNGNLAGCLNDPEIHSDWFKDVDSFVKTVNACTGYNKVIFDRPETYGASVPLSPKSACTIVGNGATFKRSDSSDETSKPLMVAEDLEQIIIEDIIFDGGISPSVTSPTATEHNVGFYFDGVSDVEFINVKVQNVNIKPSGGESDDLGLITTIDHHSVMLDRLSFSKVYCNGELVWLIPSDETQTSMDEIVVENCVFDATCWSSLCCFGKLICRQNIFKGANGSIVNCFCSNSVIEDNTIYNPRQSFAFDFSESTSTPYHCPQNVKIRGNVIKRDARGFCNLVLAVNGKNIEISDNYLECLVPLNDDGTYPSEYAQFARVFELPGCEDVTIENNCIKGARRIISTDAVPPSDDLVPCRAKNIKFVNNWFECHGLTLNYVTLLGYIEDITFSGNTFSFPEYSPRAIINLYKTAGFVSQYRNLYFKDNVFLIPAGTTANSIPIIDNTNTLTGNIVSSYTRLEFINNYCNIPQTAILGVYGSETYNRSIHSNSNIRSRETISVSCSTPANFTLETDSEINIQENIVFTLETNSMVKFGNRCTIGGNGTFKSTNAILDGIPRAFAVTVTGGAGHYYLDRGASQYRPTSQVIGFQYFDTDLGKPIYWTGSGWVDAAGETVEPYTE